MTSPRSISLLDLPLTVSFLDSIFTSNLNSQKFDGFYLQPHWAVLNNFNCFDRGDQITFIVEVSLYLHLNNQSTQLYARSGGLLHEDKNFAN